MSDVDDRRTHTGGGHIALHDARLSGVFQWIAGILGTIVTVSAISGVTLLIQMRTDMAVLKERSESAVPAIAKVQSGVDSVNTRVNGIEVRLATIEARQAEARNVSR